MKKTFNYATLLFTLLYTVAASAQDFSNKGKDFWIGYGNHVRMFNAGAPEQMQLYITSDVSTTGNVTISSIGFNQNFTVTANQITTINIPRTAALLSQGLYNHGIHVTTAKAVVVYSFIYVNAVSGATVCLPTNTLGKEYYSVNYTQLSNENNSHSYFFVVAADTGTTTVEITPSATTRTGQTANVPFTVTLTQGQIYQVLGQNIGASGVDLTGSKIRSVNTGAGCKKIGVYSGSGKISIGCSDPAVGSSDNLYQQMYPYSAWGKTYITVPTTNNNSNFQTNFYRIVRPDATAIVKLNGTIIPAASFTNGFYYQFSSNSTNVIESDKQILVAQYFTTSATPVTLNCGNSGIGDPEMIYLNPVEQTINNVTINSMQPSSGTAITTHFLNIVLPNTSQAINSFKIDGNTYSGSFSPVLQDPKYAYARIGVSSQGHTVICDSGFNLISYGFGAAESYGYSGGTNLRDLYQFVTIQNSFATVNYPATCKGSPFLMSMTFPYQPLEVIWKFNGLFTDTTINAPVYDSTWVINGRTLYRYKLPRSYFVNNVGLFPIKVIAKNPTPDGCTGEQEIDYEIEVFDRPAASFNYINNGCLSDSVRFKDISSSTGRPAIKWSWDFDDGTTSTVREPIKLYSIPGTYNVKFSVINDIGCFSDTASKQITLFDPPVSKFIIKSNLCVGKSITFSDSSYAPAAATISKWIWNFGDGTPIIVANSNADQTHVFASTGNYDVSLTVETTTGCKSFIFKQPVLISPFPKADFNIPNICLPAGSASFTNQSSISSGTISYSWDFGNNTTAGNILNPIAFYSSVGPFSVKLTATSDKGCIHDTTKIVSTVFAQPIANFNSPLEICLVDSAIFSDLSTATNSSVTEWNWDFGDGTSSTLKNPLPKKYTVPNTYNVKLTVKSAIGCLSSETSKPVIVNPLPTVDFISSSPICVNKSTSFTSTSIANAGIINQYSWKINGVPTGGNSSIMSFIPDSSKTYIVELKVVTDKGCTNLISKSISVNVNPLADFSLPNVCLPSGSSQFTNQSSISSGTISYAWDFGNSTTAGNILNPIATYSAVGPFSVKLLVTSDKGCIHDTTKNLSTVYAQPIANFTAPLEVCLGDSAVFFDLSNAPNSSVSEWNWDFGDGTISTLQNPAPKLYAVANTYTVTLSVKSAIGCPSTIATKQVLVNPLPTAQFSIVNPSCEKEQISFIDASVANAGNITTWNWNFKDGDLKTYGNGNPFNKRYDTAGNYDVLLEVITNKGCKKTITKPVRVNTAPRPNFIKPKVCLDDAYASFTNSTTIADGTNASLIYNWNFGDVNSTPANNISSLKDPIHRYSQLGPYTSNLKVTSINGCVKDTSITFTVNGSTPVANFNVLNANSLCGNTLTSIQNTSTVAIGIITDVIIRWDLAGFPFVDSIDVSPLANKIYNTKYSDFQSPLTKDYWMKMYSYSGSSCVDSITKMVSINASPKVSMLTIPGICNEASPRLINQGSESGFVPGTFIYRGTNISSAGLFNPNSLAPNNYNLEYVYTSNKGCRDSITKPITVWPSPVAKWSNSTLNCEKNAITFSDSSIANYSNIVSWKWDFGSGGPAAVNQTNASPFVKTFNAYGSYNIGLQVFTDSGCQSTVVSKLLNVHPLPRVDFKIPEICLPNGRGQFFDQSSIPVGTSSAFRFNWNFGDGGMGSVLKDPFYTFSNVGPYTIKLIVTSEFNCVDSLSKLDTSIYPQPKANFAVDKMETCLGGIFNFTDQSNGKTSLVNAWNWDFSGNVKSNIQNPRNTYVTAGTYNVSLFIYNQQGCVSDTVSKIITVHPYPTVNAGKDLFVLEGGQLTLNPLVSGNNLSFLWLPNQYLDNNTLQMPVTKPLDDITYIIRVTGIGGCNVQDDVFIKVLKQPEIPNAFSPNGDGINDLWVIKYLESYPGTIVEIYNRYGQILFRSVGYDKPWDGTFKGKQVPSGTYYYIVDPKNNRKQIAGFVDIVR